MIETISKITVYEVVGQLLDDGEKPELVVKQADSEDLVRLVYGNVDISVCADDLFKAISRTR